MKAKLIFFTLLAVFALQSKAYDAPQNVTVSNITMTTADVSWSVLEGAIQYWVTCYLGSHGVSYCVEENHCTLTNLQPGTNYKVVVFADYEDRTMSNDSEEVSFTTLGLSTPSGLSADNITDNSADISWISGSGNEKQCDIRYRPYIPPLLFENFETDTQSHADTSFPDGWTCIDADGDGTCWEMVDTYYDFNANPNRYVTSGGNFPFTPDDWLVSPKVELGGIVRFGAASEDDDYLDVFAVYVSTKSATDVNDFKKISDDIVTPYGLFTFTTYEFDLSDYVGETGYIAIRHYNVTTQWILNIDDFEVLSKESVDNKWIEVNGVTAPPCTISDLDPQTEYEVQIRAVADELASDWSGSVNFTTLASAELAISLADDGKSNTAVIEENDGKVCTVTLEGRTLYKDGSWNTICLPFDVMDVDETPLAGADIRTLTTSTVNGHHVNLSFEKVEAILAGIPYIVKWESGENVVNPVFKNVTIINPKETSDVTDIFYDFAQHSLTSFDGNVKFIGYYDAFTVKPDDNPRIYYLTSDNKLKYTAKERTLNAFRAYFTFTATDTSNSNFTFSIDFGDGTDGITSAESTPDTTAEWFTIDGRKLTEKPVQKGIYVTNGQKVVIK